MEPESDKNMHQTSLLKKKKALQRCAKSMTLLILMCMFSNFWTEVGVILKKGSLVFFLFYDGVCDLFALCYVC